MGIRESISEFGEFMVEVFPVVMLMLMTIGALVLLATVSAWYGSCRSSEVYNKLNNTSYTCSDFFWAGAQINKSSQTIRIDQGNK